MHPTWVGASWVKGKRAEGEPLDLPSVRNNMISSISYPGWTFLTSIYPVFLTQTLEWLESQKTVWFLKMWLNLLNKQGFWCLKLKDQHDYSLYTIYFVWSLSIRISNNSAYLYAYVILSCPGTSLMNNEIALGLVSFV